MADSVHARRGRWVCIAVALYPPYKTPRAGGFASLSLFNHPTILQEPVGLHRGRSLTTLQDSESAKHAKAWTPTC
jgi:hypothetical protein